VAFEDSASEGGGGTLQQLGQLRQLLPAHIKHVKILLISVLADPVHFGPDPVLSSFEKSSEVFSGLADW
jgi:hypothetical protein